MEEVPQSSINLKDVLLIKSSFEKLGDVLIDNSTLKNYIEIDIEPIITLSEFTVSLKLKYEGRVSDELVLVAFIHMVGHFYLIGEKPEYFDEFVKVNAPAIIYPFVKEHLHSLTNKSGFSGVNLPPFNFVSYSKKYFANKEQI